jgi:acylphosphatase
VKNLPDGRVEAVFEGDAAQVEAMVAWCHFGVPMSRVDEVEAREEAPPVEELKEFNIRFGRWND